MLQYNNSKWKIYKDVCVKAKNSSSKLIDLPSLTILIFNNCSENKIQ